MFTNSQMRFFFTQKRHNLGASEEACISNDNKMIYAFEDFELDTDLFQLRQAGQVQKVEPQVFAILHLLVQNANQVVSKEELIEKVWQGRSISDAAINSRIRSARLAVQDDGKKTAVDQNPA